MQKSMWLMAALLFSMFISGCGGGGSTTSVIGSTPVTLTPADVSNKTLYSTSTLTYSYTFNNNSTSSASISPPGYIAFQTYSGGSATWDGKRNRNPLPKADVSGTWAISNGQLVLSKNGTPAYQFTCLQKEMNYWLVSDGSNTITRMYFNRADAETYLNSITFQPLSTNVKLGGAIQGTPLATKFSNISTVAGTPVTPGLNAFTDYTTARSLPSQFGRPIGITTMDGTTFFVLDNANNIIRMLTPGTNGITRVTTLKASSGAVDKTTGLDPGVVIPFNFPSDITTDGANLYVTDTYNYVIKKISPDKSVTTPGLWVSSTLSGTGVSGAFDGTGNTLSPSGAVSAVGTARFVNPIGITTDGTNLYVTDDQAIRKVEIATGNVTTLAGFPGQAGAADAVGTAARFNLPLRLTTDGTNLYVTDYNNYLIRKVSIATGQVTTIAGKGTYGNINNVSTGDQAYFNGPNGITTDGTNLYVTDWGPVIYGNPARGQVIFSIALANPTNPASQYSGPVTLIAGTQGTVGFNSGTVTITSSNSGLFDCPIGITTDGTSLFVADSLNATIRKIYNR
jgi:hypothetical protein